MAVRTATILLIFVVVFTAILAGVYAWTRPAILASEAEEKMRLISEVLPTGAYNNALLNDTRQIAPTPELGLKNPSTIYRARQNGQPVALVIEAIAPDGYAGKIHLLIAISATNAVLGVRVITHKETPGLGDYIEPKKDRTAHRNGTAPWIEQFNLQSFTTIPERKWKVKKDSGHFDAYAGATVTPRAIVKAVAKALNYVAAHRDALFASEPKSS